MSEAEQTPAPDSAPVLEVDQTLSPALPSPSGRGSGVLVVNGFLTQDDKDLSDWGQRLSVSFPGLPWAHFPWPAESRDSVKHWMSELAETSPDSEPIWKKALRKVPKLLANPWHAAMLRAEAAGRELADQLAAEPGRRYILAGHSLGARVIVAALRALAERGLVLVDEAHLLGGAVGRDDEAGWAAAADAVSGSIYNCHSARDQVLDRLYRGANLGLSDPAGVGPIPCVDPRIVNVDCTDLVGGHLEWKLRYGDILTRIVGARGTERALSHLP